MISQGSKKAYILFCIFSLAGFVLAMTDYSGKSLPLLYFLWRPPFSIFIRILCVTLFGFLILKWLSKKLLLRDWLKLIGGIIFLPVLLLPVLRCYFKVPYVFCRSCPDKCPWGISRTFFFSTFVGINLSGRFWCTTFCPFGTFQECQTQISNKHFKPFWKLGVSSYVILFLVTGMYFLTFFGLQWVGLFELGEYTWAVVSVSAAVLIIVLAFFVTKPWCRYICPIGTIAELTFRVKRALRHE
jgi:polyferredoxin